MNHPIGIAVAALTAFVLAWNPEARGAEKPLAPDRTTDWNQWRGPNRNGIAPDSPKLADAWGPEGPALVWTSEEKIPGGPKKGGSFSNYGSPVVAGGKVYLYVHDQAASADVVFCLDADTGKTLWKTSYPGSPDGGGSSTPYVGGGKVYAVGTRGMYCLDAETGKEIWKTPGICKDVKGDGINTSPALVGGVLVVFGGSNGRHLNPNAVNPEKESGLLKGFDAATGKELWACPQATADANRNGSMSASVAVWVTSKGPRLIMQTGKLTCVDPKDGSVVWQDGESNNSVGTPAIVGDVCITAGKVSGYRLRPGKAEKLFGRKENDRCGSYLLHEGHVYGDFSGTYRCIDLAGNILWQKSAGGTISSPVLADGKIYHIISNKDERKMKLAVFSATPAMPATFFEAHIPALCNSSPAIWGGRLFVRLTDGVACYDLTKAPATAATATAVPASAASAASNALISCVDISPSYGVMRKGIKDQVWPPEKEAEAAALDWAKNQPLDADGWIDFITVQDSRGMLTRDAIAYARVVLETAAPGKLALSLTVPNSPGDPHGMAVWLNGANVLRQEIAHPEGPVKNHQELVVNLVAGRNTLLIRTNTSIPKDWRLQLQAKALEGLVVRQVAATAPSATETSRTKP